MIAITTGLSFAQSVVLFGAITIIYDVLGGIRAVIVSDVIQMIILTSVLLATSRTYSLGRQGS